MEVIFRIYYKYKLKLDILYTKQLKQNQRVIGMQVFTDLASLLWSSASPLLYIFVIRSSLYLNHYDSIIWIISALLPTIK